VTARRARTAFPRGARSALQRDAAQPPTSPPADRRHRPPSRSCAARRRTARRRSRRSRPIWRWQRPSCA